MASPQGPRGLKTDPLHSLLPALRSLGELLKKSGVKGMVIGGVASSLLGRPRLTADVDATVLIDDAELGPFLQTASQTGLEPRIDDPVAFALRSAVLLLRHRATGIPVDLAQGRLPFEREAVRRARKRKVGNFSIPLPTPEDLIILKAVAHRPQDLEDIRGIVQSRPRLDVSRIKKVLIEFGRALDTPKLWTETAPLLVPRLRRAPRGHAPRRNR